MFFSNITNIDAYFNTISSMSQTVWIIKSKTPRTRVAAIIIQDKKLLMVQGGFPELWTPGGKLQEGESEEECLRRELKEEIWVKITELSFFKEYTWVSFYNPEIPLVQKIYIVSITWEIKPDAEIDNFVRLSREDFEQKRFTLIRWDQEEIIPDLIKGNIF